MVFYTRLALAAFFLAGCTIPPNSSEDGSGDIKDGKSSSDTNAVGPYWLTDATLNASNISPDSLRLTWDKAVNSNATTRYRVKQDDVEVSVTTDTSVLITNLSPWTDYSFTLLVQPGEGPVSTSKLVLTIKTTDTVAPVWPEGAVLVASDVTTSAVTITWPEAKDDVGIDRYTVSALGGASVSTPGHTSSAVLSLDSSKTTHTIRIQAHDSAGNPSIYLNQNITTADTCIEDLQFFQEKIWLPFVSTDCISCHVTGGSAHDTQMILIPGNEPADIEANFETIRLVALDKSQGESLLLIKPTGQAPHFGGQRFDQTSQIYQDFAQLIARYETPGGCGDPSTIQSCQNLPVNPGPSRLRRLTSTQYHNTIKDLFNGIIDSGNAFPQTAIKGGYSSYAGPNVVSASAAQTIADSAEYIGTQIPAHIDAIVSCGNQSEVACMVAFIKSFGLRVFRRPLFNEEVATFYGVYQKTSLQSGFGEKVAQVIETFLQSPQFLYISPDEGDPVPAQEGVVSLSHYAMASRLSYFLWNSMPDSMLFDRAAEGDLNTPEGIKSEVTRMLENPKARDMVARFHNEWMHLYKVTQATKDPEFYPEFSPKLAVAMIEESERLVKHIIFDGDGLFKTLMETTISFVNSDLSKLYNIDVGELDAKTWVKTTLGETRQGLLTRAAFATAHGYAHASSPIHRGHFVIQEMFCQKLVIPPFPIVGLPEVPSGTVKDRLELHRTNAVCGSCHDRMDPLGLAFENYDGIGKYRDTYDNGLPVDATGMLDSPMIDFNDAVGLIHQLASMELVSACYAKQWFRYAAGRGEQPQDACSIQSVQNTFKTSGGNIISLIHAITQSDSFRFRWDSKTEGAND